MTDQFDDVFVTPDDIKAANDSSSFLLTIPPDAARKGDPDEDGGRATWKQDLVIASVKYEAGAEIKSGDETYKGTVVEIDFMVPPDAQRFIKATGEVIPDPNAGRSTRAWYKLIRDAQGNKDHAKYKHFNFNMSRLKGILASAGYDVPSEGFSLRQYFGTDVLINATVHTMIERSWYNGKAKDEISSFLTPKLANA